MKTWRVPTLRIIRGGTDAGPLASVGQNDTRFHARTEQRDLSDPRSDKLPDNLRPQPVTESTRSTNSTNNLYSSKGKTSV